MRYTVTKPLDLAWVARAVEASTGRRTRVHEESAGYAQLRSRLASGSCELRLTPTGIDVEAMLNASPYFLVHVDGALRAAGAVRVALGSGSAPAPDPLAAVPWHGLSMRNRMRFGHLGALGAVLVTPFALAWLLVRRLARRD